MVYFVLQSLIISGMQGMGGGMQGGMMMQNRMRGPGGMMQQQPGQQGIH